MSAIREAASGFDRDARGYAPLRVIAASAASATER